MYNNQPEDDKADGLTEDLQQLIRVALTNPGDLRGFIQANYPKEYAEHTTKIAVCDSCGATEGRWHSAACRFYPLDKFSEEHAISQRRVKKISMPIVAQYPPACGCPVGPSGFTEHYLAGEHCPQRTSEAEVIERAEAALRSVFTRRWSQTHVADSLVKELAEAALSVLPPQRDDSDLVEALKTARSLTRKYLDMVEGELDGARITELREIHYQADAAITRSAQAKPVFDGGLVEELELARDAVQAFSPSLAGAQSGMLTICRTVQLLSFRS